MRHVLLASALILGFSAGAFGNAFDESRPYRFPTSGDRFNNAFTLDIIEKKKGGFYDGFDTTNNNNNTFITNQNGDVINCTVSASAIGNQHLPQMTATTGSNVITPALSQEGTARGNAADNNATNTSAQSTVATGSSSNNTGSGGINGNTGATGSDFSIGSDDQNTVNAGGSSSTVSDQLNNNQNNSGAVTTNFHDNTQSANISGVSADGNTSNQTLNNTQNNSGNQSATADNSTGCTFNE